MPIIMRRCNPEHTPSSEWGDDCQVQWGGRGLVVGQEKSYQTAYFEAFPSTGSGFIRGEGETVQEAEENALKKRRKELECSGHQWSRRKYLNGLCWCRVCGCSQSVMKSVVKLGDFRKPFSPVSMETLLDDLEQPVEEQIETARWMGNRLDNWPISRKELLRIRLAGVKIEKRQEEELIEDYFVRLLQRVREWAMTPMAERYVEQIRKDGRTFMFTSSHLISARIEERIKQIRAG